MNNDAPNVIYLVLLLVLVGSSLLTRQIAPGKAMKMGLAWVAIFGLIFIVVVFRNDFGALGSRLRAEATGSPVTNGATVRIPMSSDGHFWVEGEVNGKPVRFLVDSGATITTVTQAVAEVAGLPIGFRAEAVETANGTVVMRKSRAESLRIGDIERQGFGMDVNANDDTNVLGMNFLSSLSSWRVEGRFLMLTA
ncbi:TIGR02281 family clan AA aspartic protease [Sphingomonas piscis]|uniref:TIGR02281 family clan AA aspartic protease n=1 Tax=Sphingomonas piscis TaxID=2714943 RepID=A0A6G7YLG6_9SPHN|nr:TIGR02281 family clan AA aspartic protease [Sphingomonas piscis]QIK77584.1 TIGR02281 family clan AA aspartic protease [Sphingomonas piscis]